MAYQHIHVPSDGEKITVNDDTSLNIPNHPIIPFIEGIALFQQRVNQSCFTMIYMRYYRYVSYVYWRRQYLRP